SVPNEKPSVLVDAVRVKLLTLSPDEHEHGPAPVTTMVFSTTGDDEKTPPPAVQLIVLPVEMTVALVAVWKLNAVLVPLTLTVALVMSNVRMFALLLVKSHPVSVLALQSIAPLVSVNAPVPDVVR